MSSEAEIQQQVRLLAARLGNPLWRNNVGACRDDTGRVIRYGLGNDSARVNAEIKSSDLIGITPVVITTGMVGQIVGVFTAVECKAPGYRHDERLRAQLRFLDLVKAKGGIGSLVTSEFDYLSAR